MLEKSAGKIQKNPNLDFPAPEKCQKIQIWIFFAGKCRKSAGKIHVWIFCDFSGIYFYYCF